jgi:hypothetical protein
MAYSCTTFGCQSTTTGNYATLQSCQEACIGWGCPPSIPIDANIYFVYDGSASFSDAQREIARTQAGIYLQALSADGWTGDYHHINSTVTWISMAKLVFYRNPNITVNPGPTQGTSGLGYDSSFGNSNTNPTPQLYGEHTVIVVFANEASAYHPTTVSLQSWWGNYNLATNTTFTNDRQEYLNIHTDVTIAGGTINCFLIPVTSESGSQAQSEINFAVHAYATIDSGNHNLTGGTLDGTWIAGTSPSLIGLTDGSLPALCLVGNTSIAPVPAWNGMTQGNGLEYINNIYAGLGSSLDSFGWSYDPTFGSISSSTLNNLLTSVMGTVASGATICLSGASTGSTSPFPYLASAECNLACFGGACTNPGAKNYQATANADCVGNPVSLDPTSAYLLAGAFGDTSCCWDDPYECTWDGCMPYTPGPLETPLTNPWIYNTQAACETGCTSYSCTTSGCSLWNIGGVDAGSGHLGTGGTYTTSGSCTGTCTSYNCGASGCLEQSGTGGTYSTSATCTASCYSYNCSITGCEPAIVGSGGTYYDITNHLDALTACTAACETWDCTDYGCVADSGSGGAYATLAACTGACQSWECASGGCQTWNSSTYQTAQSYVNAPAGLSGEGGSGGTATEALCTATCFTWECGNSGCVDSPGNLGPWDWDEENDCNLQCVSYNCTPSGCVYQLGTGGTYNGAIPLQECQSECGSYNCDPLPAQPTTANAWSADSCTYSAGTGGTFYNPISVALSLADCQTGCTSWSCQNPFVPAPGGCLEYPNTGNTLSVVSYDACTADTACKRYDCTNTGCVVGDEITGTYNSLASCTGACVSYSCTTSGCSYYNETGNTWTGVGHLGTGGTYDNSSCDFECKSWNCTTNGCLTQPGTGGTYTVAIDGATAYLCNSECSSWDCTPTGCQQHNINPAHASYVDGMGGSGGTYSSLALCETTAPCTSWNCTDTDCVVQPGTGGTYTTYNNCTGTCKTWNCTDTGCESQIGTGGTYTTEALCTGTCESYNCSVTGCDIQLGTGGTYTQALYPTSYTTCDDTCISYDCTPTGCVLVAGTGGLYPDLPTCELNANCKSWNCENIGCEQQPGTGGTYTIAANGALAPDCMGICDSWDCTATGCEGYNLPGSSTNYNGAGGTGGTYSSLLACDDVCESYNCTDTGCFSQAGTGGTYTAMTSCTGTCISYNCSPTGCVSQIGTGGTFSSLADCTGGTATLEACTSWNCGFSGCEEQTGTGGTYVTEAICTGSCQTYNCTATGCVVAQGSGGMFPDLISCTATCESYNCTLNGCIPEPNHGSGGTYTQQVYGANASDCNNLCNSWNCTDDGCQQYNINPLHTYYLDGMGGTGGTYDNSFCDSLCTSWDCEPFGCQPYNGGDGTGGTYSTEIDCTGICQSWECASAGCELFNAGEGTGGTYTVQSNCTSTCLSFNCLTTGCVQVTGNQGTWANLPTCLGGCESWNCTSTGCSQYNVLGSATYTNGSGGTAGLYTTDVLCSIDCKSWDCTNAGCQQYNVTGSISNINNGEGSGGTYTVLGSALASTCDNECQSWECAYVIPPGGLAYSIVDACTHHWNTAHTFTSSTECDDGCASWTCVGLGSIGCTEFPNTASTYTSQTECTASTVCAYYDCTIAGCVLQPGEYTGGIDSYLTEAACEASCVGWGCIVNTLASGTTIYVYYDVSNINTTDVGTLRTEIQDYISTTFPTHVGNIYHTFVSDGNWLDWSNSIYHNEFRVAPATGTTSYWPTDYYDEPALAAIGWGNAQTGALAGWYDQYSANTYTNITTSTGVISTITTHGIAPTAHTSGDTLVITLLTEANGVEINPDVNGYHSGDISSGAIPYMTGQPTTAWTTDYTANTTNWNAVTAATGTLIGLVVPLVNALSTVNSTRTFNLQALAAIRPGNQTIFNGTYQNGTAPTSWVDLSQIESMNPYWNSTTPTYGYLETKGWGLHLDQMFLNFNVSSSYANVGWPATHLTTLDQHLQTTAPTVGSCISAETLYTINTTYPNATEAACTATCDPSYYACTDTGCTLSWAGTMSLTQCQSVCTSVSCTTSSSVGCEVYNSPGSLSEQNGLFGTGGTFTGVNMMTDCQLQCFSYNCDPVTNYLLDNGCQQYIGTGQTYVSYTTCTGSCKSWDCDDPCVTDVNNVSTGLGCIEYINTGATHLTYNACTGVCQENWYVETATTTDSCNGLTWSTITSGDIDDHINKLASTAGWNNQLFQAFKFLYITTPTNATNTCYSGAPANAYWSQVNSMTLTLNSTIPVSTVAYTWNDVTSFMSIYYPSTTISTIADIENVGGVTITYDWDLCVCVELPCIIGCTTSTSIPANTLGSYPTHLSASTTACTATTWSCATNTIIDDCDGLSLVPGLFTNAEGCYEWFGSSITTYGLDFTTFKCEVMPTSSTPLAQCELGPNNGELIRLTGITSSIVTIASNNYTSLTGYTAALVGLNPSVTNALNGLPLDVLQNEVHLVYPSSSVHYGWADCECDSPYSCGCVEMFDGTGAFTSKTHCELSCCTATTWNCASGTQYLPICGTKTYLGQTNNTTSLLEYYRVSAPTTLFGVNSWALITTPQISWTQVQTNMALAGAPWGWNDCYSQFGNYTPNQYLYTISHTLINGGALYQTWNDFYTAVNAVAGITLSVSDTIADINTKINTHFVSTAFNVIFDIKSCCNDDDCYCYDTLDSSGTYANELLCDSSCCPSETLSWACVLDSTGSYACAYGYYGPPINTVLPSNGPWTTLGECQTLSLGGCSTSWKCPDTTPCNNGTGLPCVEVLGHYLTTGHYETQFLCDNNTDINDCCGLQETYTCDTGTITSNLTNTTNITGVTGTTLGYLTNDDVLTYLANPTASPSNQNSGITDYSFCVEESSQTVLSNLPNHCKCGDGCGGVLHLATGFTFNNFNQGSTDTNNAFNIVTYPYGYCTTWSEFIDQLNIVWGAGAFSVNLAMTYQQVVDEVNNGIGVSQFGIGTTSCVDSSEPCGCVAVFDGSGVSLQNCILTCCTETSSYTCTPQGCKSRCDDSGEYQTLQDCELECWEWRCNQDIWGCTDPTAFNYDPLATIDDGSCILPNDFWSCGIADDCSGKTDTGVQTLSHVTGQISAIAGNPVWHSVSFDTLKFSLGGGNNQPHPTGLPCDPCEVPGQAWGQPGPYYAYIKYVMCVGLGASQFTSWSSFIDALNLVLGYSFTYTNSWQDLQAVLGHTRINAVWDWCDCSGARTCVPDNNGNYVTSAQCYSDVNNDCTSWRCDSTYVESCSGTTYMGPYTNFNNAANGYVGTYPLIDLSAFTFSVATIPLAETGYWTSVGIPPCAPPVGPLPVRLSMFPLLTFTGITINQTAILAGSMAQLTFTSWLDLITAINAAGTTIPTLNSSMDYATLVQTISLAGYGNVTNGLDMIDFEWGYCMCGYINCNCVEVPDGTGPYPSMACCEDDEEGCCHVDWDCPGGP